MIKAAKEKRPCCCICTLGEEYKTTPNKNQIEMAQNLQIGADIIIGTHPHVLQTIEELRAKDGRLVLVAYSLGILFQAKTKGNV